MLLVLLDSAGVEAKVPVIVVKVSVSVDGTEIAGFPVTKRVTVDETQGFHYERPDDGDAVTFGAMPTDQIASIATLVAAPDRAVTVRLDGQTDAGIYLNGGGLLVIVDGLIDAGAGASNTSVNNNSGDTVRINGMVGGT